MRINLNGYVVADEDQQVYDFFGLPAFCPATVRKALEDNPEGETLVLEVNSYGGSVWAGGEIYTVLRSAEVDTRAEIQSIAASAASYLSLGCDEVWISPVAQMMIHLPECCTQGNRDDHGQSVKMLNATEESILNTYEAKSGGKRSREDLQQMMQEVCWLTAQDALDAGLVDGILFQEAFESLDPGMVVNSIGSGIRSMALSCRVPDIAQLRAKYAELHPRDPAGEPPAENTNWQEQARLAIEKNRF